MKMQGPESLGGGGGGEGEVKKRICNVLKEKVN